MRNGLPSFVLLAALAGCGSTSGSSRDASANTDLSFPDLARPPDLAVSTEPDLAPDPTADLRGGSSDMRVGPPDLAQRLCAQDKDCRLFSSYCLTAPCVCIALHVADDNPPCPGGQMVTCLRDPCEKKMPVCQKSGICMAM